MSDISQIAANGITYNIKDTVARNEVENKILYFSSLALTPRSTEDVVLRIPTSGIDDSITPDSIVLSCEFTLPRKIKSRINWQSYNGYMVFTGIVDGGATCYANVTIGKKKIV